MASVLNLTLKKKTLLSLLLISVLFLTGCASVYRLAYAPTGNVLNLYAKEEMVPYLMTTEDVGMACALGESTSGLLLSFQRVISRPNKTGLAAVMTAGLCSEMKAFNAELRYQRALFNGHSTMAKDASMEKNLYLRTTTRRRYRAYKMFKAEFGVPGKGECPYFGNERDKLFYLMGILTGVQAVQNDLASDRSVGVPQNIIPRAARGSKCLDDKRWWGLPMALRGVTWSILPGSTPDGTDPWQVLEHSTEIADEKGIRLAYAFQVLAADNKGKMDVVKESIREAVESRENKPAPKKYRLLDKLAFSQMRPVSDRIWTKETGHRTPPGELGTFPQPETEDAQEQEELDTLLP